jgi:hypothetical protein
VVVLDLVATLLYSCTLACLCPSPVDYELLAAEIDRRLAEAERTDWDNQMLITEDFLMDRKAAKKDVCATLLFRPSMHPKCAEGLTGSKGKHSLLIRGSSLFSG